MSEEPTKIKDPRITEGEGKEVIRADPQIGAPGKDAGPGIPVKDQRDTQKEGKEVICADPQAGAPGKTVELVKFPRVIQGKGKEAARAGPQTPVHTKQLIGEASGIKLVVEDTQEDSGDEVYILHCIYVIN